MNKSTNNISLYIFIFLTILITVFIFSNSLKNGEESNAQSEPIVEAVETLLDPKDEVPTATFNYIIRKAAHITEFAVLGLTLGGQVWCVKGNTGRGNDQGKQRKINQRHIAAVLLTGVLIAAADEFIQRFTGRTSSVTDVLIDFAGVVIGMSPTMLFIRLKRNRQDIP